MMKKLFLLLAVVALASCVKENTLAPELQDGQVRISAVAADSKALLEELNVVWEDTDAIALLLNGETKVEFEAESVNGASADFVGVLGVEYEDLETAYAVYPATAFNAELKVEHTLPADQTAGVTSGMLLASAKLDVEDLKDAQSTATFNSALTLLQVVVPEGVKEVALEASRDGLVGQTTFNFNSQTGLLSRASVSTPRTVKLAADAGLEAKTYPVLVYPGNADDLKLTMTATDGAVYESTVPDVKFTAGEARKIDLTKLLKVNAKDLYVVLPAGETFEVPVVTTDYYPYAVSCTADWVSYEVPTKGFHKEAITFTVAQNTTGADREAEVTISWGDRTKSFTIQQKNIFMDFVSTDENPLEWEENFGLFTSEDEAKVGNNPAVTYRNVFTIELSDDYIKGTYKIKNIFKTDNVLADGQPLSNKGGEYYAYYADGKLTVKMAGALKSYFFNGDIVLTYDEDAKTFAADPIPFESNGMSSAFRNAGFIGGYTAAVKVEEEGGEEGDGFDITSLYGVYNENFTVIQYQTPSAETTEISESDDNSYDIKIKFFYTSGEFSSAYDTAYGKVNASGTEITVTYLSHSNFMSKPAPFVLTVSEGTLSGSVGAVTDYKATKKVSIAGTYAAAWKYAMGETPGSGANSGNFDFTIKEESSDKGDYLLEGMFPYYGKTGTYYAKMNGDKLTILANNSSHNNAGVLPNDIVMTVSGTEITFSTGSEKFVQFGQYMAYMNDFSATMKK